MRNLSAKYSVIDFNLVTWYALSIDKALGETKMVGTMTAPLFAAAATYKTVSLTFIDASGDIWTGSIRTPVATTPAQIDTMVADIVERSNASLYETALTEHRVGARTTTNATVAARSQDVRDTMFMTFTDVATGASQRIYIPAPLEATFEATTGDVPNLTDLADLGTSALVVLGAGYTFRSARYSKHKDQNAAVKP